MSERQRAAAETELVLIKKRTFSFDEEAARYRRRIYNLESEREEVISRKTFEIEKLQLNLAEADKDREALKHVLGQFNQYIQSVVIKTEGVNE